MLEMVGADFDLGWEKLGIGWTGKKSKDEEDLLVPKDRESNPTTWP
jgi:hypothetical protein